MHASVSIGRSGQFDEFERRAREALKAAALRGTDRAARQATTGVREQMRGAGLGRLANAVGGGSDLRKGRGVHEKAGGFSASGWINVRGGSERTRGAIEAYTQGATITGRNGSWLAIATDEIPKRAGRQRMTPKLYAAMGLEQRIGPLIFLKSKRPGEALLVVRNVTTDRFGRAGRARAFKGRLGATREHRPFIIAFVLVRTTTRAARFNPTTAVAAATAMLPALIAEELRKET